MNVMGVLLSFCAHAEKLRMEQLAQQQEELSDIHNGDIELLTTAV